MKTKTALLFTALVACGGETKPSETQETAKPVETTTSVTQTPPSATPAASATPVVEKPAAPTPPTATKVFGGAGKEFATPEGVVVDDSGLVLISNINGKPLDVDNNGFISAYSADGKIATQKWIEGGKNKVTLNAPKGMAIAKGVLYVADIDTVRTFDAKTGAPKAAIKIAGATFLNDVAAGPDGKIYVSDSGMKAGEKGFDPTGTDAVHVIEGGKAKPFAKSADLGRPNGLFVTDKGVWVCTFASGEVYRLDAKGAKQDVMKPATGGLDGLAVVGDMIYVSSWEGGAVYKGKIGGTFESIYSGLKAPADFALDKKNDLLIVPWFMDNKVEAYPVK